ncbi:MAG: helix-turn-helix transcriptional regulator [Pseudomonadota bacterium]
MRKNHIKELRKGRGWSQNELARNIGTSNQQVSYLETGQRRLTDVWMLRLAAALGCHPADLLEYGPERVTRRERMLVNIFRGLSEEQKTAFFKVASALAQLSNPLAVKKRGNR